MADVVHRTTMRHLVSVHGPDYPVQDWIHNPDLSAVRGFDSIYWKTSGDSILLMTASERAAVDAARLNARRDSTAAELDAAEGITRAFALALLDEINTLRSALVMQPRTISQMKTAVRNKLGT